MEFFTQINIFEIFSQKIPIDHFRESALWIFTLRVWEKNMFRIVVNVNVIEMNHKMSCLNGENFCLNHTSNWNKYFFCDQCMEKYRKKYRTTFLTMFVHFIMKVCNVLYTCHFCQFWSMFKWGKIKWKKYFNRKFMLFWIWKLNSKQKKINYKSILKNHKLILII